METKRKDLLATSGRITPREVLDAYQETGLEPVFDDWYDTHYIDLEQITHACGFTVVALANASPRPLTGSGVEHFVFFYGTRRFEDVASYYKGGFARGFDGKDASESSGDDHPLQLGCEGWERKGWRDGKRARAFVLGRGK